ncbi:CehA/McbA family metallohydrolase domain-containing protein [Leeuwenhoekiella marinoflava]|uniref:Uncharacterized protein n=2 Tax=Leeuwenhoekiella marinoflava TaxID=988 RepID=A0A4Q0PQ39_9FLAO|nr:hypothetical protein [Leeuwenhoekiella marinoflava]RXG31955.1 hypothetical protein DSL99_1257 [Leeuwenhoekiella marinoflava]SHE92819.1 hypothetical protein SAMN02745246_01314 [Leeuwenhoekiella marinoflava DSM 3653]
MRHLSLYIFLFTSFLYAQVPVSLPLNNEENTTKINVIEDEVQLTWLSTKTEQCRLVLNRKQTGSLFKTLGILKNESYNEIVREANPEFIITQGERTLEPEKGWTIFFDKVPNRPNTSDVLKLNKRKIEITKMGKRTVVKIGELIAPNFEGFIEITIYNNSPLINIAAVVSTEKDATAILYDAGITTQESFKEVSFSNTEGQIVTKPEDNKLAKNEKVKYRSILGTKDYGALAIFPAPHQYFYPLDEAFNLDFVWHGFDYRNMLKGYGMGIRQNPEGDKRFVPWFNAPPNTQQRLNFFCLLGSTSAKDLIEDVKKYTHKDTYAELEGYQTLASHFHNEFIMNVVMKDSLVPEKPEFVTVLKDLGVDIVHLGEFHYTAHPKGPDDTRLKELDALFKECERLSDNNFLLLPGEEPNEFLGGHWMAFFPKPVYWIMSRDAESPFLENNSQYGKIYRIGNKEEMQKLLELENGLAWTAHPRIKGSTGYPDVYREENFFKSDRFLGGAWKAMPADLSKPKLGSRVLDLLDDMNNWGLKKNIIAESDLFTITQENEMYAHMNINYMQLDEIPRFEDGWHSVTEAMSGGKFFSTTGEVLIPSFTANEVKSGDTLILNKSGKVTIDLDLQWTFPLNYIEVISGDGKKIYRDTFQMDSTTEFDSQIFSFDLSLKNRKWVRVEVWDVAANGAFTQSVYLKDAAE